MNALVSVQVEKLYINGSLFSIPTRKSFTKGRKQHEVNYYRTGKDQLIREIWSEKRERKSPQILVGQLIWETRNEKHERKTWEVEGTRWDIKL